jgi:alkanesulfonate monooxygenase SsuD/methylene tetrahydromethanopterin reductase-like flavin-dependent oxidoreductase (luciferase family)
MTTNQHRFNIGFFSYLQGTGPIEQTYRDVLDLFTLVEELGLDNGWVAQHHFGHHGGLPSPFVFFSALAARVQRINLGTAIVSLPFEHPIRVAEDAAVFETIYPGRLQLGLGTGFASDAVMETFGHAGEVRRAIYDVSIERLLTALEGKPVNADDDRLTPPAGGLRQRLWEAPSRVEGVVQAAQRGSGLLLSRVAIGVSGVSTDDVQRQLVDAYYDSLPDDVPPRIALSRTVYPSNDPDAAYRDLAAGLNAARKVKPTGLSLEDEFEHFSIHYGKPADVAASILTEPLLPEITDLIFQVQPGTPDFETTKSIIRLMATEVAPALGWTAHS